MEPTLELATQITSHLWLLHELYPDEGNLSEIVGLNWRDDLQELAAHDFSRLQQLLDLTGQADEADWDARDPLQQFQLGEEQAEQFHWKAPLQLLRTRLANRKLRRGKLDQIRIKAAGAALDIIGQRINAMSKSGLVGEIDLFPRLAEAPNARRAILITRDELFEKVANWLLTSTGSLTTLADAFSSADDFLMHGEITRRATDIDLTPEDARRDIAKDWLAKGSKEQMDVLFDRARLHELCHTLEVPIPFSMVLTDELTEIGLSRLVRLYGRDAGTAARADVSISGVDSKPGLPQQQAFRSCLFGLALSGGGIRSATFALGLLQGMADRNVLPYIDVLSTVSGGGYIGSWLIAWIKRRGNVNSVQSSMRGSASSLRLGPDCPARQSQDSAPDQTDSLGYVTRNSDPHADHVRPIRLLREYSRYLAPQEGAFSADTWTIAATWTRNTALNLAVLLLLFGAVLLLPRTLIFILVHFRAIAIQWKGAVQNVSDAAAHWSGWVKTTADAALRWVPAVQLMAGVLVSSIPILVGCWLIGRRNLRTFGPYRWQKNRVCRGDSDAQILSVIIPWILLGAFMEVAMLWHFSGGHEEVGRWAAIGFSVVVIIGVGILARYTQIWDRDEDISSVWRPRATFLPRLIAVVVSSFVGWFLIKWLVRVLNGFGENTERGLWLAGSVGIALMLLVILCVFVVFLGLAGKALSDEQREWWSRLGAWFSLVITAWLTLSAVCFFVPLWSSMLGLKVAAAGFGWAAITFAGVKIAFSAKSGRDGDGIAQKWLSRLMLALAPPVFVLGLLSFVSFGLFWGIQRLIDSLMDVWPTLSGDPIAHQLCCTDLPISFQRMKDNYWPLMYPGSLASICLMIALILFCLLLAWRVDVNEFSMHHFYKNRLVRAYLGASRARAHRYPNAFTGFDLEDDIRLCRFTHDDQTQPRDMTMDCKASYGGPYPILNTTLNITRGEDLGIQERKAESFVFTPMWSGFDFSRRQIAVKSTTLSEYAFQRTDCFGEPENSGALLGTAMAISGAAFNSNAGFHTSPSLAFLLTVFGVRLGWWAGNPRGAKWHQASPGLGLLYLIQELMAQTSASSNFVLLSDGGHFENMALYELIRRRCRYIIVSDAEEDEKFKLQGIGGAVRKCRDDFGVVIDLDIDTLQPIGDPAVSRLHYSLGTIIYPGESECGKLLYIKSSVTGDEPVDVIEFRKRHPEFPHTTTVDQFFDESHFESYRALGHHIASEVFSTDMPSLPLPQGETACEHLARFFGRLESDWRSRVKPVDAKGMERIDSVRQPNGV